MMRPIRFVALVLSFLPAVLTAHFDVDTLTVNRWLFPLTDYGPCGVGARWRLPSQVYLFGGGPWFGTVYPDTDTLVSVGYNPNSGASEFRTGDGRADTLSMVYIWPDRWPAPHSRFPHAPQVRRSDQDAWCCFNDFDFGAIQVYLTAYGWQGPRAQDLVILQYEFENACESTLSNACYVGFVLDPDIGDAADDMYGAIYHQWLHRSPSDSFYVDHVAYAYDEYDSVGYVGVALIKTPENRSATAIKEFTIDIDPVTDQEQFLTMAGYDYRTGIYDPIDSVDFAPGDKRFLVASGPFTLGGAAVETMVVVIGASTDLSGIGEIGIIGDSLYRYGVPGVAAETRLTTSPSSLKVWPNPFGSCLWLELPGTGAVGNIEIREVSGRLVRTLSPNGRSRWQGDDSRGGQVAAGIYFVSFGNERLKVVRR
jgi:hypothetical protein